MPLTVMAWALEETMVTPVVPVTTSMRPVSAPAGRVMIAVKMPLGRSGSLTEIPVPLRLSGVCSVAV